MRMMKIMKVFFEKIVVLYRKILNKYFHFIFRFPNKDIIFEDLVKYHKKAEKEIVFVFPFPSCPWGYMFQRPQQLAKTLASKGYLVIYCVDTSFPYKPDFFVRGLMELAPNLLLFNDGQNGEALKKFDQKARLVIWQYWPHQYNFIKRLEFEKLIYDCIDDLTTFNQYDDINKNFEDSLEKADLVLVTADNIAKEISKYRNDYLMAPNAVKYDDFSIINHFALSYDSNIPDNNLESDSIIIGYYGAIADWVNLDLIEYCAKERPRWKFVLIGQQYPNLSLPQKPNILYYNRQPYEKLPYYLSKFDVAILPFKINDITMNTSPVKIFEYMAGGKPVVSTRLPEVEKYDPILIADSNEEFLMKLEEAYSLKNDETYISSLKQVAFENTWEIRVESVLNKLHERGVI